MFSSRTLLRFSNNTLPPAVRILVPKQPIKTQSQAIVKRKFSSNTTNPADNAFNRERAATKQHAAETAELWRKLSIYVAIPCLLVAGINAYNLWTEHWEHEAHKPPPSERTEYPYQNIRSKNFFWGDGDKTLFWNDKVNYHKRDE